MASLFDTPVQLFPLRPRQQRADSSIRRAAAEGHRRIMLFGPTGFGKTVVMAHLVASALEKGKRPLITVPRLSLVRQTVKRFEAQGIHDIGVIQGDHEKTDALARVQIASIQTLVRRPVPDVDFVLIDEAHIEFEAFNKLLDSEAWNNKIVIGVTATPWNKGMGLRWTKFIVPGTTKELIEEGWLTPLVAFGVPDDYEPDVSKVHTNFDGDYMESEAEAAMTTAPIVGNVVRTWLDKGPAGTAQHPGDRAFMFCVNRSHAKKMQAKFEDAGVPCGYIDGTMDADAREHVFEKYRSGEIKILSSIDTIGVGIDEDVRSIIYCRLTRSEKKFVQDIGRGLRTADGKESCIARDSLVLTQSGLVKIQDISLEHLVWDGVNFVHHRGAICKGIQTVIEHDGVIATPDHEVMTNDGFQRIDEAKRRQARIVTTGIGREPIWFSEDRFPAHGRWWLVSPSGRGGMFELWANPFRTFLQHAEETRYGGVPALQREAPQVRHRNPEMAIRKMQRPKGSMLQSISYSIQKLWGQRNRVSLCWIKRSSSMDCGELRDRGSLVRDRQNRQQWPLRAGKSAVGNPSATDEQYSIIGRNKAHEDNRLSKELSTCQICRSDSEPIDVSRLDGRGNPEAVGDSLIQTKREVWDILSAGPLQRFTVNGKLVHNCLLLDHAGSCQELGIPTDIHHDTLDTHDPKEKGQPFQDKKPPKPYKCKACNAIVPKGREVCPICGAKMPKPPTPRHVDGELVEVKGGKAPKKSERVYTMAEKQAFYSGLLYIAQQRGYKEGWAANQYRSKFQVWPDRLRKDPVPPSFEVRQYEKYMRIRYAKGMQKREAVTT